MAAEIDEYLRCKMTKRNELVYSWLVGFLQCPVLMAGDSDIQRGWNACWDTSGSSVFQIWDILTDSANAKDRIIGRLKYVSDMLPGPIQVCAALKETGEVFINYLVPTSAIPGSSSSND